MVNDKKSYWINWYNKQSDEYKKAKYINDREKQGKTDLAKKRKTTKLNNFLKTYNIEDWENDPRKKVLEQDELFIVENYFGLNGNFLTLRQIAKELGISQEGVRYKLLNKIPKKLL
jgi:DNA-directed RNA polymerase sigma subunit (sigma70/sigma32)